MNLFFLKKLITLKSTVFNIDQFNLFIICGKSQNSGIWIPYLLTFLVSCWDFPVEELLWKEAHAFIQLIGSEIRLTHTRLRPKTAFLFVFSMSLLNIFVQNLSGFLAKIQFFFFVARPGWSCLGHISLGWRRSQDWKDQVFWAGRSQCLVSSVQVVLYHPRKKTHQSVKNNAKQLALRVKPREQFP